MSNDDYIIYCASVGDDVADLLVGELYPLTIDDDTKRCTVFITRNHVQWEFCGP